MLWYSGPEQKYRKLYTITSQHMAAFSTYFLFRSLRSAGKVIIVKDQIKLTLKNRDDAIKWKHHFPRCWPFVREIHWPPVDSAYKRQARGTSMFSLIFTRTNVWANGRDAGDLRRHSAHHDVTVMIITNAISWADDVQTQYSTAQYSTM